MVKAVYDNLAERLPKNHFTIGIKDDVSHTSLDYDREFSIEPDSVVRAMFYGLGADGTVGGNKNSIKIIGENTTNSTLCSEWHTGIRSVEREYDSAGQQNMDNAEPTDRLL